MDPSLHRAPPQSSTRGSQTQLSRGNPRHGRRKYQAEGQPNKSFVAVGQRPEVWRPLQKRRQVREVYFAVSGHAGDGRDRAVPAGVVPPAAGTSSESEVDSDKPGEVPTTAGTAPVLDFPRVREGKEPEIHDQGTVGAEAGHEAARFYTASDS